MISPVGSLNQDIHISKCRVRLISLASSFLLAGIIQSALSRYVYPNNFAKTLAMIFLIAYIIPQKYRQGFLPAFLFEIVDKFLAIHLRGF